MAERKLAKKCLLDVDLARCLTTFSQLSTKTIPSCLKKNPDLAGCSGKSQQNRGYSRSKNTSSVWTLPQWDISILPAAPIIVLRQHSITLLLLQSPAAGVLPVYCTCARVRCTPAQRYTILIHTQSVHTCVHTLIDHNTSHCQTTECSFRQVRHDQMRWRRPPVSRPLGFIRACYCCAWTSVGCAYWPRQRLPDWQRVPVCCQNQRSVWSTIAGGIWRRSRESRAFSSVFQLIFATDSDIGFLVAHAWDDVINSLVDMIYWH